MRQNLLLHSLLYLAAGIRFSDATSKCDSSDDCVGFVMGITEKNAANLSSRRSDCSSFMAATSVLSTTTTTVTITAEASAQAEEAETQTRTATKTVTEEGIVEQRPNRFRRGMTPAANIIKPSAIPKQASSFCSASSDYASACSCWGITKSTVTAKALTITITKTVTAKPYEADADDISTVIKTLTVTTTATPAPKKVKVVEKEYKKEKPHCLRDELLCSGACRDVYSDCEHCGACGVKCKKGAVCVNGVCSEPACKGVEPWGCNGKNRPGCNGQPGEDCFCLHSGEVGFCATYMTLPICPEAQVCKADKECPLGQICGSVACCGKKRICVEPHGLGAMKTCGNSVTPSRLFRKTKARRSADPDPEGSEQEPGEEEST
ncbi:hypothetical protein TWF696_008328 [Orbilia brochopaga]|uniref:IGFBP N-terminal domain-containing protein n=1 Tax=Orbilia brochopaga TaxID=3140254 RepID=A0AAV9UIX9_9PEZI